MQPSPKVAAPWRVMFTAHRARHNQNGPQLLCQLQHSGESTACSNYPRDRARVLTTFSLTHRDVRALGPDVVFSVAFPLLAVTGWLERPCLASKHGSYEMTYYTGSVTAVPTANKQAYLAFATAAWPMFQALGATRIVETWGVDVPHGEITDFHRAVGAGADETVVFSWIIWPDKATSDSAWQRMQTSSVTHAMPEMPFDGKRMIYGGFLPVFENGHSDAAHYYQGFLLAVPLSNKDAYVDMAEKGWTLISKHGALGMIENWGEDVPRGEQTDFYRATRCQDNEVPVFSWSSWPDRASCDAAATAMAEGDTGDMDMANMPFDGTRMTWAGFEALFDSSVS